MLETERLIIKPLNYNQLLKYLKADNSLEEELNLKMSMRKISPELLEAFEQTILPNVADPSKNYLFCTLWTGISKNDRAMVGEVCITGEPDAEGNIEIGYGTHEEFRGRGYMTEMVGAIIAWARNQSGVSAIIASCDKDNRASISILAKNNFVRTGKTDTQYNWKLKFF
ncbi:GNAT family N-acetyltransferase [Pollutibacter soli]|uniref:GNAT family N-acetyltransferase n=1 Tax=Pollutibacter soli TaxID=3034157 RepID=UPI003013EFDC